MRNVNGIVTDSSRRTIVEVVFDISLLLYFCTFLVFNNDFLGNVTPFDSLFRNVSTVMLFLSGSYLAGCQFGVVRFKLLYFKSFSLFVLFGLLSTIWAEEVEQSFIIIPSLVRILILSVFLAARIKDKTDFRILFNIYIISLLIKIVFVGQMMYGYYGSDMIGIRFGQNFGYNPNDTAVMCVCAIAFLMLYIIEDKNYFGRLVEIAVVLFLIGTVLLTESKKGFVGIILLPIFYSLFNYKIFKKNISAIIITIIIMLVFISSAFFTELSEGALERMDNSMSDGSTIMREKLIYLAIDLWKDNPIIGIGINNFALHSGVSIGYYSHNNYTEILSGLGIIGFLLYYIPIVRFMHKIKRKWESPISSISSMIKSLVLVLFILDVGNVSYFSFPIQVIYILLSICAYYCMTYSLHSNNRNIHNTFKKVQIR